MTAETIKTAILGGAASGDLTIAQIEQLSRTCREARSLAAQLHVKKELEPDTRSPSRSAAS